MVICKVWLVPCESNPRSNHARRTIKTRSIPTVRDKLLQTTCSKILEVIYEPKFYKARYGYRKGKGAKDAVKHLSKELNFGKYGYIVEADIKGYFENINHDRGKYRGKATQRNTTGRRN